MIFVTVGSQMPFDRLIRWMDEWVGEQGRTDVEAQIGPSDYQARHLRTTQFLTPSEFRERIAAADAVVGHAGMGTIIESLQLGKPLLVLPRVGALGETRNDHQVATARRFSESGRLLAAYSREELISGLGDLGTHRPTGSLDANASPELIERIRRFVFEE